MSHYDNERNNEIAAINELLIDDCFFSLLDRLVDFSNIPQNEAPYLLSEDEELSYYERITLHESLTLPSSDDFDAEFIIYKNELIQEINNRYDELERIYSITERYNAIEDIRGAINEAGLDESIPNVKIELKRIIKENDITQLELLENSGAAFIGKEAIKAQKIVRKEKGKKARMLCTDILDLMAGFNLERELTSEQINELKTTFAAINGYLMSNQPWAAKVLIDAIEPDDVLVTAEIKQAILNEFTESGLPGF